MASHSGHGSSGGVGAVVAEGGGVLWLADRMMRSLIMDSNPTALDAALSHPPRREGQERIFPIGPIGAQPGHLMRGRGSTTALGLVAGRATRQCGRGAEYGQRDRTCL
jgi:hypothetical protein